MTRSRETLILVLDDEPAVGRALERLLRKDGHGVVLAESLAEARRALERRTPDVVLADMLLADGQGIEINEALKGLVPRPPLVIMTGRPSVASAVTALRGRAFDYLAKPFEEGELASVLARALEVTRLRREVVTLRTTVDRRDHGIVGRSPAIEGVRGRIEAVAAAGTSILITGESGVGKERVARAIHELSGRKGPFVALNCGAVPENLFEAELFGAAKGAYTGSVAERPGLVAEAKGGTLLLDEIGDMPATVQPKLLRLLQERTYRSLGRDRESRADVRILSATNRPLREMVEEGRFREDLYWRLAVVEMPIPPLRERREDIASLAAHILARLTTRLERSAPPTVAPAALAALERHDWPGNIRELENVLERALLFSPRDRLEESDLHLRVGETRALSAQSLDEALRLSSERTEREYIVKVMKKAGGSVSEAAKIAGRNRTAFYRLLERHRIPEN